MKKKRAVLVIVILIVGFFVLNVNVMTRQTEEGVHGLRGGGGGGGDYKPFLRPQDEAFEEGYAFVSINRFTFSYFNRVRRTSI